LPIVMGDRFTKWTIIGINTATVVLIGFVHGFFIRSTCGFFSYFYILFLLVVPVIFISWKVHQAATSDDYRRAAGWMKWVMIAGIAYCGTAWLNY